MYYSVYKKLIFICFINQFRSDQLNEINMRAGIFVHKNCRNLLYPQSLIERFPVPDQFVFWFQNYPEYAPIFYESPVIKGKPWADPDKSKIKKILYQKSSFSTLKI